MRLWLELGGLWIWRAPAPSKDMPGTTPWPILQASDSLKVSTFDIFNKNTELLVSAQN
jgi:hypothetical protein